MRLYEHPALRRLPVSETRASYAGAASLARACVLVPKLRFFGREELRSLFLRCYQLNRAACFQSVLRHRASLFLSTLEAAAFAQRLHGASFDPIREIRAGINLMEGR